MRDKSHFLINNLKQEDFKIFEDGQEQKVAYFSKEVNLPISLAILVDTSGSQVDVLGAEQDAASRFVHRVLRKTDEALVMSFDLDIDLLADFTEDTSRLEERHSQDGDQRGWLRRRRHHGNSSRPARTAARISTTRCISRRTTSSPARPDAKLSSRSPTRKTPEASSSVQDAIEAAQRSDSVVHVLLISDVGFYYRQMMGYGGSGVAKKMADETGGRVIEVHNNKSLEQAFDELSDELRQQYVLGYYPTNPKHDGRFERFKIEVNRPDLKILARRGYYSPTD